MNRQSFIGLVIGTLCWLSTSVPSARADHGTVVSGTVIAIDVVNQIMRVYVTAVDGQALVGGPDTNFVDYLVSPDTAVISPDNVLISQSNVVVGSRIQMQFAGAYASRILLIDSNFYSSHGYYHSNYTHPSANNGSFGMPFNYGMRQTSFNASFAQTLQPGRNYTTIVTFRKPSSSRPTHSPTRASHLHIGKP